MSHSAPLPGIRKITQPQRAQGGGILEACCKSHKRASTARENKKSIYMKIASKNRQHFYCYEYVLVQYMYIDNKCAYG
jgi:hypothetical protein